MEDLDFAWCPRAQQWNVTYQQLKAYKEKGS